MINIRQQVYEALRDGCPGADVSDEMPKEWSTFPKVTFTEERNDCYTWTDDEEKDAIIGYRIDCWNRESISGVMGQVDSVMAGLGFKRTGGWLVPVRELYKHSQMRYEAIISKDSEYVFHEY